MHEVHTGADEGRLNLAELASVPHLYAVGPLAGLRGEITIFDGAPSIATVKDGAIVADTSFQHQAAFLIHARVEQWEEISVPETVATLAALEDFIREAATERGLGASQPFAFLLKGASSLRFHVMNKQEPSMSHAEARVTFSLEEQPVEIIGFYSDSHQGVLTHHDRRTHMHFRTTDLLQSGHVDDIRPGPGMVLSLPKAPGGG